MKIPPCPHCGKKDFVYRNVRMYGWAQEYFDLDGQKDGLDLDYARTAVSKTIRCCSCGKIRRDLAVAGQEIRTV